MTKTEGGHVKDLEIADWEGFELLKKEFPKYDTTFFHIVGIDHSGHVKSNTDFKLMNNIIPELDRNLKDVVKIINGMEEEVVLYVFGDHGMNWFGNHGNTDPERGG